MTQQAVKFVIRGTISTVQDWSTAIWLHVVLGSDIWGNSNQQAVTDAWRTFANSWWDSLKGFCAADTTMTSVATYFYPPGFLTALELAESIVASPVAGTGATPLPTQSAVVASFRTGLSGKSYRGRSYFPMNGQGLGSDHQLSGSNCGSIANAYATLLTELNAYDGSAHNLTSQTAVVASFTKGTMNPITEVLVDSKIDTQRRREDKIAASSFRTATP